MKSDVILYGAKMCSDCQKLKDYMESNEIDFELRDIKEDQAHADAVIEKTGKLGVPYLIIRGEWKRGYEPGEPFSEDFARGLFAN